MSKFIKRIGTSASKFMIELHIQKVELNLIQSCRISIVLKRGDHVLETKTAVALEKGVAKFDEKIVIPATLYFEKKKNAYIKKEASVSINVITPKVTRLAGVTKLDLAQYPNSNITEQDIVQNVDKCFDKNAKLYFKLRMIKVSDILPDRKGRKPEKEKKPRNPGQESGNENESKDRSESPLPSRIEGTDMHDYSDNSSIPDLSKFDGSKSQTGGFGFGKNKEFGFDDHSDGELDGKLRSRTVDALKIGRPSISEGGKGNKAKNFFDTPSEMTVNDSMSQGPVGNKLLELEVKVKNYQKENKELYNKIREDNEEYMNLNQDYEDLKLKYERLQKDYDNLANDKHLETSSIASQGKKTDFEVKIYKDKVAELEKEIKEIKQERDEANERADELQQATQDLLAKIETYKNKEKKNGGKDADTNNNVEEYITKVNDLTQKLKEAEKKVKELTESQKNGKNKSMLGNDDFAEIENSALKRKVEEKDSRIDELERQMGIQANELQLMKKMASSAKNKEDNSQQFIAQLETMEKKQKGLEETYKKRIEELTKQNTEIKRELEQSKNASSSNQFDAENELAKLSIENESLKRQVKDLNARILNVKYDNKEVDEMRRRIAQLEVDKDKVDAELVKAKMGWASSDMEKDDAKSKLKAKEESTKGQSERMEILEKEVFRLRSRIAELMNAVMEFGEMELLDQIEAIITHGEDEGANQEQVQWKKIKY